MKDSICKIFFTLLFGMSSLQLSTNSKFRKIRRIVLRANGCRMSVCPQDKLRRSKSCQPVCSLARLACICFAQSWISNSESEPKAFLIQVRIVVNSRFPRDLSEASPKTLPARPAQALRVPSSGKRAKAFTNLRELTRCLLPRREPASLRELNHSAQSRPLLVCVCVLFGTLK
jgi:hypothetical protein